MQLNSERIILFLLLPCTTLKHTITVIALITLLDYIQCKYMWKAIASQEEVSYCRSIGNNEFVFQIHCKYLKQFLFHIYRCLKISNLTTGKKKHHIPLKKKNQQNSKNLFCESILTSTLSTRYIAQNIHTGRFAYSKLCEICICCLSGLMVSSFMLNSFLSYSYCKFHFSLNRF